MIHHVVQKLRRKENRRKHSIKYTKLNLTVLILNSILTNEFQRTRSINISNIWSTLVSATRDKSLVTNLLVGSSITSYLERLEEIKKSTEFNIAGHTDINTYRLQIS